MTADPLALALQGTDTGVAHPPPPALRFSRLKRRILAETAALMRDRNDDDPDEWVWQFVPVRAVFAACRDYWPADPAASWVRTERNARQAFGRSLHRLHANGLLDALALAWVNVGDEHVWEWQGTGTGTPAFKMVSVSAEGLALLEALERDALLREGDLPQRPLHPGSHR